MAALNAEIPDDLKRALDLACAQKDMSLKRAITEAIERWLGQDKPDEPNDPDWDRVLYIFGHTKRENEFRGTIDLFYRDSKQNPRENDKSKRKAG